MLEFLGKLKDMSYEEQYNLLHSVWREQPMLPELLEWYVKSEDRIITPHKILKMMRYFKVEKRGDINDVGEIGNYAALKSSMLKRKEFGRSKNKRHLEICVNDIKFLMDCVDKLKKNVVLKNQYITLKNCFTLVYQTDVMWFTRLLCQKVKVRKSMLEVVKDAKIYDNL